MTSAQFSNWANEVQLGEIYATYDEGFVQLENAYQAVNNFCRKEQKRGKTYKKRRACWD
jgi:hypothetical protein